MRCSPFDFFHPALQGSSSMKNVARAIGPDLDYGALLAYCKLETWAMVRLAWTLEGREAGKRGAD
jgi:hypothetical protein